MDRALAARLGVLTLFGVVLVAAAFGVGVMPDTGNGTDSGDGEVRYVTVTFDDGFESQYRAADALEDRGMRGVYFVSSGVLDGTFEGFPTMTGEQVRELEVRGHEIGGHTYNHTNISGLDESGVRSEIEQNRAALAGIGVEPVAFAYPYGQGVEHRDVVADYYPYARTVNWDIDTVPPEEPYTLGGTAVTMDNHESLEPVLERMAPGEWLVITLHHIDDEVERSDVDISRDTYADILDRLDRPGIAVVTFQDMQELEGER